MEKKRYSKLEILILSGEQDIINRTYPEQKENTDQGNELILHGKPTTKLLRKIVKQMRKKRFYIPKKEQRKIDWSAYTLNQINDIVDFQSLLLKFFSYIRHFKQTSIFSIQVPRIAL